MTFYYLPLEPYEERYTHQLKDWTVARLQMRNYRYRVIDGRPLEGADHIRTGVALDAHGRCYYALTQMARLVRQLDTMTAEDVIYLQDLFQPGYEALPYILAQVPVANRPRIYTHNLAQSIDPADFTFPMRHWMRHFELLVDETITGIFVASSCQVEMMQAALFTAPIHVVGLAFDKGEVQGRVPDIPPLHERSRRVVYTSRFDREKQPWYFLNLVERVKRQPDHPLHAYEFAILTGAPELRSNHAPTLTLAHEFARRAWITIHEGLSKTQYYTILADSVAQVNTAKQDFVSNTLNESSALFTPTLAPAYLSFPEALFNNRAQLWTPWSVDDLEAQLIALIQRPPDPTTIMRPSSYHHATLDRVFDVIEGEAS